MRISRKILILVSIPLAFQLGMSAFLFDQVQATQKRIEQELERKRLVATLDKIHHLHIRSLAAAAFYSINKSDEIGKRHAELLKELTVQVKELARQTSGQAELSELTQNLRQSIATVVKYELLMRKMSLMTDAPQLGTSQQAREAIKDSMHQIENFQSKLIPPVDDLQALQKAAQEQLFKLAALLLAIVGIITALLIWSQKNILEVLETLLKQIARFRNGEVIQPDLKAGTEVAELESVICDSANRIATLERMRRELSSIVSHDVRAPMTSIEGVVTLLEAGAFGELNQEQEAIVSKQKRISGDLLSVLNNILDLDKVRSGKWNITISPVSCQDVCNKLRADVFALCSERDMQTEFSEGLFTCDVDALSRAIVALVGADDSDAIELNLRCTPSAVEFYMSGFRTETSLLRGEYTHREQIALGLAELFADAQNLKFSVIRSDGAVQFSFLPRSATGEGSAVVTLASPGSGSAGESRRAFSKVGRRLQGLISLPMAVSVTAVVLYGVLLNQLAQDISRELVSREIVHRTTNISSGNTQLLLLSIRRVPGELGDEQAARARVKAKVDANLQALKDLESRARLSMPDELALVQKKVSDVQHLSDELVAGDLADLPEKLKGLTAKNGALSSIAFVKAGSLLSERESGDTTTKAIADMRMNVLNLLVGASVVTVLLTIYSARRIALEFVSRLNNVGWNARRLARREPLREPDKGNDEIADLDAFFYKVASQIDQLESERRYLAGILREQLKKPLLELRDGFKTLDQASEREKKGSLNEKGRNRIQRVLVEINRLSDLVDDLLVLDSLDEGGDLTPTVSLSDVTVREIVEPSVEAVIPQAELRRISIVDSSEVNANYKVRADVRASIRILINLLSNAIKFSQDESAVTVSIETNPGEVVISVTDTGRGIPESEKHKIFSRFDQVAGDDSSKGSGLGLFISRKLAEAQGGMLSFESVEGKGTSFRLSLPTVAQ